MLLDNQWVTDKINEEIKKYLKTSEYENTSYAKKKKVESTKRHFTKGDIQIVKKP